MSDDKPVSDFSEGEKIAAPASGGKPKRMRGAYPTPSHRWLAAPRFEKDGIQVPDQYADIPSRLSYWLNNQAGDCVTAEEAFAQATQGYFIHDDTVRQWAASHGVLNGASLDEVLQGMRQHGFDQGGNVYSIGSFETVEWTNDAVLRAAIITGPVKIGVAADQLENAVGTKNGWVGMDFTRDNNLDHCVTLCGFGKAGWLAEQLGTLLPVGVDPNQQCYLMFTWNTIGIVNVASMRAITGEAWVRHPTSVKTGTNQDDVDPPLHPPTPTPTPTPAPTPTPTPTPPGPSIALPAIIQFNVDGTFVVNGSVPAVSQGKVVQVLVLVFAWYAAGANPATLPALLIAIENVLKS